MVGSFTPDLLATPDIVRPEIIGPWMTERNLILLFGTRGSGKTNIALGIAQAAAAGTWFLKPEWSPRSDCHKVIYFDSEMGKDGIKQKIREIDSAAPKSLMGNTLKFVSFDDMGGIAWNISDPEVQAKLNQILEPFSVIIFDNLLGMSGPLLRGDDDVTVWKRIEKWLIGLRESGRCVIIVHHSSKSGAQWGTILKENVMDTVVKIIPVFDPEFNGMSANLLFEKARWCFGTSISPLRIKYEKGDERQYWHVCTLEEANHQFVRDRHHAGWKRKDIERASGLNSSQVHEILKSESKTTDVPLKGKIDYGIAGEPGEPF